MRSNLPKVAGPEGGAAAALVPASLLRTVVLSPHMCVHVSAQSGPRAFLDERGLPFLDEKVGLKPLKSVIPEATFVKNL